MKLPSRYQAGDVVMCKYQRCVVVGVEFMASGHRYRVVHEGTDLDGFAMLVEDRHLEDIE